MKLVNYNYGYLPPFSCVIRGKIVMTRKEWFEARKYLFNPSVIRAMSTSNMSPLSFRIQLLRDYGHRLATQKGKGVRFCLRVTATQRLVKRYGLTGYKRQNYMVEII